MCLSRAVLRGGACWLLGALNNVNTCCCRGRQAVLRGPANCCCEPGRAWAAQQHPLRARGRQPAGHGHLNAGIGVAKLGVICHDIRATIVAACEAQAERLGQVNLWIRGVKMKPG